MARKTPQEAAAKWKRNTTGAGEEYKRGVLRVTESPTQAAAANLGRAKAAYNEAIDSGRTAAALQSVTLPEWQAAASGKGAANFSSGVSNVSPRKVQSFERQISVTNALADVVNQMPTDTIEQRLAKASAMGRALYDDKRRK